MKRLDEPGPDRRGAVRTCLRYAAGAALAGLSAGLGARTLRTSHADRCVSRLPCRQCSVLADCRLPRAQQTRKEERKV